MSSFFAGEFKANEFDQDLSRLVGSLDQHMQILEKDRAIGACACLVNYLELLRDESGLGRFKLNAFDLSQVG